MSSLPYKSVNSCMDKISFSPKLNGSLLVLTYTLKEVRAASDELIITELDIKSVQPKPEGVYINGNISPVVAPAIKYNVV